jgi:hypothetical protein
METAALAPPDAAIAERRRAGARKDGDQFYAMMAKPVY